MHSPAVPSSRISSLSVETLLQRHRRRRSRSVLLLGGTTILALLLFALLGSIGALLALIAVGGSIVVSGVAVWLWHRPVRGLYVIVFAAVALDVNYAATTDNGYYIAHYLPVWQDLTAWTNVHIVVSVAELFMTLWIAIWLLKAIGTRTFHFQRGTMLLPVGLYMGMILIGELHGVGTGGNITTSLWELRSQIYMLITYVLACNLIKTRQEVVNVLGIFIFAAAFRALEGIPRYFIYFRGQALQVVDVYPHEQAFFFNAFITLTAIFFLYGGPHRLKKAALALLPFVLFIDFAVNRRASVGALGLAALLLLVTTLIVSPQRRRLTAIILIALAVGFPPYYLAFQHKVGTLAEPARAIASMIHPDSRDAASNQYRISEDYDIMATVKSSTVNAAIGYGFGKTMLLPQPLPSIGQFYKWWDVMPHNSILWVWMRIGTIGYILLWFMIGTAVMQSVRLARRLRNTYLQGLSLFVAIMLVQEVVFGYLDLQWTSYRNLVAVGLLFALISVITKLAAAEGTLTEDEVPKSRRERRAWVGGVPGALAVVNGRLEQVRS